MNEVKRLIAIVAVLTLLLASPALAESDGAPGPCLTGGQSFGHIHNGPASDNVSVACDHYTEQQAEKAQ